MGLDSFAVSAIVDEFMDMLVGGRIQDVIDVDATGIGLEVYSQKKRHYVYISADKQTPRIHQMPEKLRRGVAKETHMGMMLRRYIERGRLVHVSQPPWERILILDIERGDDEFQVIVELMPRRSNIVLVRDGVIIDSMYRIGPEDNRYRLILPKHEYHAPPPQENQLHPYSLTVETLEMLFGDVEDANKSKIADVLTRNINGFNPLLSREIVFMSHGEINTRVANVDVDALLSAMEGMLPQLENREWDTGIILREGIPHDYAVYRVTHKGEWDATETVSDAITSVYGAASGIEAYDEAKKPVFALIEEGRAKFGAKMQSLENGLKDDAEREILKQSGELILAYQYQIDIGQTILQAQYDMDAPMLEIKLDEELTPLENAQRYFDKYNRAKRALENVPELIALTQAELDFMDQLEIDLEGASNWVDISDVVQALDSRGVKARNQSVRQISGGGRSGPLRLTHDGYVIWIGRNSRQNEKATFKHGNSNDLWLHTRGVPGAHGIIRNDGRRIPETLIERVASIVAYYSKYREEKAVIVDVTRVKYVKKIKGAGAGMVTYRNEETVTVTPQNEEGFGE